MTPQDVEKIMERCQALFTGFSKPRNVKGIISHGAYDELRKMLPGLSYEEVGRVFDKQSAKADEKSNTYLTHAAAVLSAVRALAEKRRDPIPRDQPSFKLQKKCAKLPWDDGQVLAWPAGDGSELYGWVHKDDPADHLMRMYYYRHEDPPVHKWVALVVYEHNLSRFRAVDANEAAGIITAWVKMEEAHELQVTERMPRTAPAGATMKEHYQPNAEFDKADDDIPF